MKHVLAAVFVAAGLFAGAQDTIKVKPDRPIAIAYYPFMHISQAFKVGVDLPLKNRSRIEFSPMLYSGMDIYENSTVPRGIELSEEVQFNGTISGFGFEMMYRYAVSDWMYDDPIIYVGAGAGIHSMTFKYKEFDYYTDSEVGLDFVKYGLVQTSDRLFRTDVFGVVGMRTKGDALLAADISMGVVYRTTEVTNLDNFKPRDEYGKDLPSHGGNGFYFRIQAAIILNVTKKDNRLFKDL